MLPRNGIILRSEKASEHLAAARKHLDDLRGMAKGEAPANGPQSSWLAYAKAGYASADFDLRATTGGVTSSSSNREHGWMMGIGIDYALSNRIIAGVEYDWFFFSLDPRTVAGNQADASASR